jgi:hypothetical protein
MLVVMLAACGSGGSAKLSVNGKRYTGNPADLVLAKKPGDCDRDRLAAEADTEHGQHRALSVKLRRDFSELDCRQVQRVDAH